MDQSEAVPQKYQGADMIDERITDQMSGIDWHAVTEGEAASFGLALGLYRDQAYVHQMRRVAWMTTVGGAISMSVLTCACLLVGLGPYLALGVVIATQATRAGWLYWKSHQTARDVAALEEQAVEVAAKLAELHPKP